MALKLQIGDKAPTFDGLDHNGEKFSLKSLKGKKVVLYFYPKDNTPGCTAQACNLKDNYKVLQKQGYDVIGISGDDVKSHLKFVEKYDLPFLLIADPEKTINELYGVWQEKSMYGKKYMGTVRTTFIINEKGIIEDIIEKVKTKEHTSQILK